jgi:hypothetical protein
MMTKFQLSEAQLRFFDTFGFLSLPGLMIDQIDMIISAFEKTFAAHGGGHAGKTHDGKQRSCIIQFIDRTDELSALLDEPRIEGLIASLLGDDFNYMGSDGNYYVGDTGWHSDGWHAANNYVKVAFYLDPLTRDTGALRVIPGSHRTGEGFAETVQRQISGSRDNWGVEQRDVPAIALETKPGDVVVFNHNTKHAAFGGGTWRRMFTINCARRVPEAKLDDLKQYIGVHSRFWIERMYHENILNGAGPGRRVHLEQVMANDGHLAALSAASRAQATEPSRG